MKKTLSIHVRVAGILVEKMALRRKILAGHILEVRELVVTIPDFGTFALDDDMSVSVCDYAVPQDQQKWEDMDVVFLKEALLLGKYVKNQNTKPVNGGTN